MQQNRHYWLRSGTFNILLSAQSLVFSFASFYLLIRMLDKHHFGVWTLFMATTTIFDMARSGLIQYALIRFLSSSAKEDHADILSASFFLSGILMIVCIVINVSLAGYLSRIWHYPDLVNMFYAFNLVYLLQGILSQFQWIEQSHLSFTGILFSTIVKQGGFFAYILASFITHTDITLMRLIYAQIISTLAGILLEYFFVKAHLDFRFKINFVWVKKLFNYGKYVFGTFISGILSGTVSQMMLGAMLSPDAAGAYNIALKIINLTDIPTASVGAIVFPQSAKRFAEQGHDALKYLYEKSVGTILALLIPPVLFLFIFPKFVVHIVAGGNYPETIPIVQITILACVFNPFSRLFGTVLDSMGKTRLSFLMVVYFTVFNLTLTYFLIKPFGIMGPVYANLFADVVFFFIIQIILHKQLRINAFHPWIYAARFYPEFYQTYAKPFLLKYLRKS